MGCAASSTAPPDPAERHHTRCSVELHVALESESATAPSVVPPGVVTLTVFIDHGVGMEPKQLRRALQKESKELLSELLSQPLPGGARVVRAQLVVLSTGSTRNEAPDEENSLAKHMRHLQSAEAGEWPAGFQDESFHAGAAFLDGSVHFGMSEMDSSVHDGKTRGSEDAEYTPEAPSTPLAGSRG